MACKRLTKSETAREKRIFELSQVKEVPTEASYQIPFRHLCNLLQINSGDTDAVIAGLTDLLPSQEERLRERCVCAWNWISNYSPEDFRWVLRGSKEPLIELTEPLVKGIVDLHAVVERLDEYDEKQFSEEIYAIAHRHEINPPEFFKAAYLVLIGKERGPKLAGFVITCGKEKILPILGRYL